MANQLPSRNLSAAQCALLLENHCVVGGQKIGFPSNHVTSLTVARAANAVSKPHVAIRIDIPLDEAYTGALVYDAADLDKKIHRIVIKVYYGSFDWVAEDLAPEIQAKYPRLRHGDKDVNSQEGQLLKFTLCKDQHADMDGFGWPCVPKHSQDIAVLFKGGKLDQLASLSQLKEFREFHVLFPHKRMKERLAPYLVDLPLAPRPVLQLRGKLALQIFAGYLFESNNRCS